MSIFEEMHSYDRFGSPQQFAELQRKLSEALIMVTRDSASSSPDRAGFPGKLQRLGHECLGTNDAECLIVESH